MNKENCALKLVDEVIPQNTCHASLMGRLPNLASPNYKNIFLMNIKRLSVISSLFNSVTSLECRQLDSNSSN